MFFRKLPSFNFRKVDISVMSMDAKPGDSVILLVTFFGDGFFVTSNYQGNPKPSFFGVMTHNLGV